MLGENFTACRSELLSGSERRHRVGRPALPFLAAFFIGFVGQQLQPAEFLECFAAGLEVNGLAFDLAGKPRSARGVDGIGQLACDGALADQTIDSLRFIGVPGFVHLPMRGGDGRVPGLGGLGSLEGAQLRCHGPAHGLCQRLDMREVLFADVWVVGAVVGDVAALEKPLRDTHGFLGVEVQLNASGLLQPAGGQGRVRGAAALAVHAGFDNGAVEFRHLDRESVVLEVGPIFRREVGHDFPHCRPSAPGGFRVRETCRVALPCREVQAHMKMACGHEDRNLAFAYDDQGDGRALHAACREGHAAHAGKHRTDDVTHQPIQHAAGLLGSNEVVVDARWRGQGLLHHGFLDGREAHALGVTAQLEFAGQVPGNGFALAVRVGANIDLMRSLALAAQPADDGSPALRKGVERLVLWRLHAYVPFGQVADMTEAGDNTPAWAKDGLQLFDLALGLDDE